MSHTQSWSELSNMDQQDPLPCTLARSQPRWSSNRKDAQSWFGSAQGWYSFYFQGVLKQTSVNFGVWPLQFCWWLKDIKGMLYRGKSCSPENHRYWAVYKDSACHLCTKSQTSCKCLNLDLSFLILRKDMMFTFQLWSYGHLVGAAFVEKICHRWHEVMPSISP